MSKIIKSRTTEVIGTFAMKPKRDALGRPIPGRFVRFWGGRKPSKYIPHVEDAKHEKSKA